MVINYADILLVVIVLFGVFGSFRGVRAVALTTAAVFFGLVVVWFSGDLVVQAFRRVGVALDTADTQALFKAVLFVFAVYMASLVLTRIVNPPRSGLTRSHKLWGLALGLINGFLIMAVLERYISDALAATAKPGSPVSLGIPALSFGHPDAATWTVKLVGSSLTLLPPNVNTNLWDKLPTALVLLLLFLAFVFVGTVYGRLSRGRSRG